jgi:hypothetical protein
VKESKCKSVARAHPANDERKRELNEEGTRQSKLGLPPANLGQKLAETTIGVCVAAALELVIDAVGSR